MPETLAITRPPSAAPADPLAVPAWATRLPGTHLSAVRIANAAALSSPDLTAAVAAAYADLLEAGRPHPVRFWNFLPNINARVDDRQSRYMAFNAGRFAAFERFPGTRVATASAVGHGGPDLAIHCLWADRPGTPVDNPRQVRPHDYSARYGPRPPCFARATRSDGRLLVGGTASIVGERSVHADLPAQVRETLANLSAVLAAAGHFVMADVRAYHVPAIDPTAVRALLPSAWRVETVPADLCRPELLVEIEALAEAAA